MPNFPQRMVKCLGSIGTAFLAFPAASDPIPMPWQAYREEAIRITNKACEGDEGAITEVHTHLAKDNPAMMNATHWLRANCDDFSYLSEEAGSVYQEKAARNGYPIAMSNYGLNLIRGNASLPKEPAIGVKWINAAIEEGYGMAAIHVAGEYTRGENLSRNLEKARQYLKRAEAEGVTADRIQKARALIEQASTDGQGSSPDQSADEDLAINSTFAAAEATKEAKLTGELVAIPAGSFQMGCLGLGDVGAMGCSRHRNDKPVHRVTLEAFKMQAHEVTWYQYQLCVDARGCSSPWGGDRGWGEGDRPVIELTWDDIQKYIEWLNTQGVGTFRLPSEAEWEYAARAGEATNYHWGNSASTSKANFEKAHDKTMPVKSYAPNAWGLYDMHGNVAERVRDCWNDTYEGAPGNGQAWLSGECKERVIRGGSWSDAAVNIRSDARHRFKLSFANSHVGFRLVKDR